MNLLIMQSSLFLCETEISSSAPYYRTLSACSPRSISETKFHTRCVELCYIIVTISSVVKQTICLVLSQTFLIRVFVQFDTQNLPDAVGKASGGTTQYHCTLSCHLNPLAFLSRLWRSSLQFRRCASASAISAIISFTVGIAFEIPHLRLCTRQQHERT